MRQPNKPTHDREWTRLVPLDKEEIRLFFPNIPERWILVDSAKQRLILYYKGREPISWPISTAKAGLNGQAGSNGTPSGLHTIQDKIGDGVLPGTVFESREPTGEIWSPEQLPGDDDLILDRIMTLAGLEEGINRGEGCDSLERYIYIHGTNHEADIGRPVSHGCVRMTREHVVELFELVNEGDPVVIL